MNTRSLPLTPTSPGETIVQGTFEVTCPLFEPSNEVGRIPVRGVNMTSRKLIPSILVLLFGSLFVGACPEVADSSHARIIRLSLVQANDAGMARVRHCGTRANEQRTKQQDQNGRNQFAGSHIHPPHGDAAYFVRRFKERAGYLKGALNYRLARGCWRQGETAGVHPVVYGCGCVSFFFPEVGGQTCKRAQPTGEKQARGEGNRADWCVPWCCWDLREQSWPGRERAPRRTNIPLELMITRRCTARVRSRFHRTARPFCTTSVPTER